MIKFETRRSNVRHAEFAGSGGDILVEMGMMVAIFYSQLYNRAGEGFASAFRHNLRTMLNDDGSPVWDPKLLAGINSVFASGPIAKAMSDVFVKPDTDGERRPES